MTGNPEVLTALQAAVNAEAQLNLQYRLDQRVLKFLGVDKVASHAKCYGNDTHYYLKLVTKRLLFLGGTPAYAPGPAMEGGSVQAIVQNELRMELAALAPYETAIQTSMRALDDATRNLFEHLIKWHQKTIAWLEQQLRLIETLGIDEYIAEKL